MKKKLIAVLLGAVLFPLCASAQRWSFSTNAVDWMDFATINAEAGVAVAQHMSVVVGGRYNPWTFKADTPKQFQDRRRTAYAGVRVWPWHIYSGWWFGVAGQYQEYNHGGLINKTSEEGDAVGGVLSVGYTLMLHKRWNVEFGASIWGGKKNFTLYECPKCGRVLDSGNKAFIQPNTVMVSLAYIF